MAISSKLLNEGEKVVVDTRTHVKALIFPILMLVVFLAIGTFVQVKVDEGILTNGAWILVERIETPDGPAAVVGVGINVSLTAAELPVPTATSLAIESGVEPDRTALLVTVLRSLREAYDLWQAGGDTATDRLRTSYADACVTVGREVRVELPGGSVLTGRATGVDPGGRLIVTGADGETVVGAGDVVHVRAVDR